MPDKKVFDGEDELLSLHDASKLAGYTPEYLNMLARKKKMKAVKIGRNWFTTSEWLNEFFHLGLETVSKSENITTSENVPAPERVTPEPVRENKIAEKDFLDEIGTENFQNNWSNSKTFFAELENTEAIAATAEKNYFDDIFANHEETEKSESGKGSKFFRNIFSFKKKNNFREVEKKIEAEAAAGFGNVIADQGGKRWGLTSRALAMTVIIILVFLGSVQMIRVDQEMASNGSGEIIPMPGETGKIFPVDETRGRVLGTQTENGGSMASEKYAIREIKFGGDVSLLAASYENFPLQINNIRSEIITTKKQDEFQLLVYWKTNKLALSDITYSKMGAEATKTIKEDDYGYSHSVVIPGLEAATAYTYVISAKDKWGNKVTSDRYSSYTGAKNVSVFDLIVKAAEDTFGWAKFNK